MIEINFPNNEHAWMRFFTGFSASTPLRANKWYLSVTLEIGALTSVGCQSLSSQLHSYTRTYVTPIAVHHHLLFTVLNFTRIYFRLIAVQYAMLRVTTHNTLHYVISKIEFVKRVIFVLK